MIQIRNMGRLPLTIDTLLNTEMKTTRPPLPGAFERIEDGDVLEIRDGRDIEIILKDDIISIRGV